MTPLPIDSVLFVGFGGPTPGCCHQFSPCPGEATCFVRAVIRHRPGAEARVAQVVAHYDELGGFSPFNPLTFQQAREVTERLRAQGITVPVYVGMRYWAPYVHDVLAEMAAHGRRHTLAVILSVFQCAASWEQYQETVEAGLAPLGERAPQVTYLEPWYTQQGHIEAIADAIRQASQPLGPDRAQRAALVYTAHSIPAPMATQAPYTHQFAETAAAATNLLGRQEYTLAYQSQATGTPFPWLQPDINDAVQQAHAQGYHEVIVAPIGFLCDHVEVLYDLDTQARQTALDCGMTYVRAATAGNHPAFLAMLSALIVQRIAR